VIVCEVITLLDAIKDTTISTYVKNDLATNITEDADWTTKQALGM